MGSEPSDVFSVSNGLRQGCTTAPTLFNLFFTAVIKMWREECGDDIGMEVGFVNDKGKLTGVRKKRETTRLTEMQFADDAAAVFTTREGMVASARRLIDVARRWGLTVSVKKTEFMVVGEVEEGDLDSFEVEGGMINPVKDGFFQYLGSKIDCKGGVEADVLRRLGIASTVFGSLRRSVWNDKDLSARTKRIIYTACVWGTLNYGMEAWAIPAKLIAKLETFHNSCLRTIAGVSRRRQRDEHITTEAIREKTGLKRPLAEMMRQQRLRWLGHVGRMDARRWPYRMLFGKLSGKLPPGGVKLRWKGKVKQDLKEVGVEESEWFELAQDRKGWEELCQKRGSEQQAAASRCERCGKEGLKGAKGLATHARYCGVQSVRRGVVDSERFVTEGREGGKPRYRCSRCGAVFKTLAGTMRHTADVCSRSTTRTTRRLTASDRLALGTEHQCAGCGTKYRTAAHLDQHRARTKNSNCKE